MQARTVGLWCFAGVGMLGLVTSCVAVFFVPGEYGYTEGKVNMALSVLPFFAVSVYLFARRPEHLVARLLLVTACALCLLTGLSAELSLVERADGEVPLLWVQALLLQWSHVGFAAGLAATFVAFPDAQITDGLRRWVLRGLGGVTLVIPLLLLVTSSTLRFDAALLRPRPSGSSPLFVPAMARLDPLAATAFDVADWLFAIGIVALLVRRDRPTTPIEQVQLRWMTAAGLLYILFLGASSGGEALGILSPSLNAAAPCLIFFPVAIAISILRHQLLDVEVVIRKSVLYGALTLIIGFTIAGAAATLGLTAGSRLPFGVAVGLTVALMLASQPLRRRLEQAADRWVFGERISGVQLLVRFGGTLEHAYDLSELAPQLASATVDGLKVKWARVGICLASGSEPIMETLGAAGDDAVAEVKAATTIPLVHAGELVGVLECGPKADGALTPDDLELLATLGRQAALGIHNARLAAELSGRIDEIRRQAAELTASRTRIVQAQDAERRRIERNIHDGAQQEIVALMAKLRLARNQLARSEEKADVTLAEIQDDARALLGDLRDLAQGIHPPVLTDRGLLAALDARACRTDLPVQIEATSELRTARFPDDVEGAAFFFASEAIANAIKHASASRVVVRLELVGSTLVVQIEDDGIGFVAADRSGSGLANMRDRVEALHGKLRIVSAPGRGTRVRAELPTIVDADSAARSDR